MSTLTVECYRSEDLPDLCLGLNECLVSLFCLTMPIDPTPSVFIIVFYKIQITDVY